MSDLFQEPIAKRYVRNGVTAYKYRNGIININGHKYLDYSFTEAIKLFRQQNPIRK